MLNPLAQLDNYLKLGKLPPHLAPVLRNFFLSYATAIEANHGDNVDYCPLFYRFINLVIQQIEIPFQFDSYHVRIKEPFNYYKFGLELFRPLIQFQNSKVYRLELVEKMESQLAKKENIILLANHQTEPDAQIINLLLEKSYPRFAEEMIMVAGHRVISDPLAIPLSMGCNLLCIYSKRYIETIPELKQAKLQHNQRTMKKMKQLLSEGGKTIYVAPSGGRDRLNQRGEIEIGSFDPQSVEMFWLMAQQATRPTHFYSLALDSYHLLPPPKSINKELGEPRHAKCTAVNLAFGDEINMEAFPGSENLDKRQKRKARAEYIWKIVKEDYDMIT